MVRWAAVLVAVCSVACAPATKKSSAGSDPQPEQPNSGDPDAGSFSALPSTFAAPDAGSTANLPFGGGDWTQYRHDAASTWVNPGRFSDDDAKQVAIAWKVNLGGYPVSQPVVAGGSVYVTDGYSGAVFALDADTGAQRWTRTFPQVFSDACSQSTQQTGIWAAPAVVGDDVLVASPDGSLYALKTSDGSTDWNVQLASPSAPPEFVQSSPAIALGKIFLGISSVFGCDPVRGRALSVDVGSHGLQVTPLTSGAPGAPVWSSASVDEASGKVFLTTGDLAGATFAQEPLAQAIVALDAHSLAVVDSWQDQLSTDDSDFGASPTLLDAGGQHLVAAPNKDGWLLVLNRDALAAGPIWKVQLAVAGDPVDATGGKGSLVGPTFAHGLLIAAGGRTPSGEPGSITAFDPATGKVIWRDVPQGYVLAGMPAVGDVLVAAVIATGNAGSLLDLIDIDSGKVLQTFGATAATYGAPTVAHGTIYWATSDGTLTALRAP